MAHQIVASHAVFGLVMIPGFVVVGVVVARRQPHHPIGWILFGIALAFPQTATRRPIRCSPARVGAGGRAVRARDPALPGRPAAVAAFPAAACATR
jgi:hypothetical protein